jgi:hypothetical protein
MPLAMCKPNAAAVLESPGRRKSLRHFNRPG